MTTIHPPDPEDAAITVALRAMVRSTKVEAQAAGAGEDA
jgi:hypothetical protein